ncbi:hypothetical protein T459_34440 [Capsicum annuum]|uniref:Uncharacterized protein n=1 Tax=Capsicum annuum TaxID=4072 RepID=A0A2G2XW22_CAPAN|nr:hypothetical protein T459_34440 [Capsicum annuum]
MVENKGSTLFLLPSIWDLVKLRLLSMISCSFFDLDTNVPIQITKDSKLENLRVLENLMLSYSKDIEDIFIRFPNLQELVFILKESWDYSTKHYWFPKLDFLTKLDFLRVDFESSNTNDSGPSEVKNWSCYFHLPLNLKKLWLYNFPLTSNSLSTVARLPNLEVLFLMRTIMQGDERNMGEEDTFENLKFLYLDEVTLATWKVGENTFPILGKFELRGCHMLEEIPPSFGDICSLKIIKLEESPQLGVSAKKIKQYVEDLGGDELQADLDGVQINVHYAFGMASTASSPWRSKTAPSATRLLVNAARMETMRYLWMSSCSLSYGACLLIDQKLPRVRVIRTRDQKVSQLRNSSYTGQWQDGGST